MNDSTITLPWLVIRQDDNGNRYRVGRYATRAEAQKIVDNVTEEVGARPGLAEELHALGGVPGHVVLVIQRTFFASGRPVETADVVVPADRYRVAYHLPVK